MWAQPLQALINEVALLPYARQSPALAAQFDPRRQTAIERYLQTFVLAESFRFGDGLKLPAHQIMNRLGPDAIPAMVRLLNKLASDPDGKIKVLGQVPLALAQDRSCGDHGPCFRTFWFV